MSASMLKVLTVKKGFVSEETCLASFGIMFPRLYIIKELSFLERHYGNLGEDEPCCSEEQDDTG